MMLIELSKLQHRWKIVGVTPHDLLNWIDCKIKIAFNDQRLNDGKIECWVDVNNPDDDFVSLESTFAKQVRELVHKFRMEEKSVIRESDIADRFRQQGKLFLVLRPDMRVVDEASIRVYGDRCRSCNSVPADRRDGILQRRQSGYCRECFVSFLPADVHFKYIRSTLPSFRIARGYGIQYDPVLGLRSEPRCSRVGYTQNQSSQQPSEDSEHDD